MYMYGAKPLARDLPLVPLIVVSFNVFLRVIAGVVAVVGSAWTITPILLVSVTFYFYFFGGMAAFWKIEGEYLEKENKSHAKGISRRLQTDYYVKRGLFWQHTGLVGAIFASSMWLFLHQLTQSICRVGIYARCLNGQLVYTEWGPYSPLFIATAVVFVLLASMSIVVLVLRRDGIVVSSCAVILLVVIKHVVP